MTTNGKVIQREWKVRGISGRRENRSSYGYTVQINGKQERMFNAAWSREDAEKALRARLGSVEAGVAARSKVPTFGPFVEQFLALKKNQQKREGSLAEYTRVLRTKWIPYLGADMPLAKITTASIAQYEAKRLGEVSSYTVCNELAVIRHALRVARKLGFIETAPDVELPRKPDPKDRFLSETEIARLLEACTQSSNPHLLAAVVVALNTGLRIGEIRALKWNQINFSTGMIVLGAETKGHRGRGVPLTADLYDTLQRHEADPTKRVGLVFQNPATGDGWARGLSSAFERARVVADLKGFRFHDLRHTFASWFIMRQGTIADLQQVLGHRDIKLTMRYAHLSPSHLRASMARMDGLTGTALGHPSAHGSAHKSAQSAPKQAERRVSVAAISSEPARVTIP